jgi:hypothetical protein
MKTAKAADEALKKAFPKAKPGKAALAQSNDPEMSKEDQEEADQAVINKANEEKLSTA